MLQTLLYCGVAKTLLWFVNKNADIFLIYIYVKFNRQTKNSKFVVHLCVIYVEHVTSILTYRTDKFVNVYAAILIYNN